MVDEQPDADVLTPAALASSLEELYWQEWHGLLRLALVLCGNAGIAEELVQETFVKAYRNWAKVQQYESPQAWLRRVLVNTATSRLRRAAAEARAMARLSTKVPPYSSSPETEEFWRLVRGLPPRQAQVVALFYGDDMSVASIASVLDVAEGTVRALLHQARLRLAESMKEDDS